jgi:hypothetical protein
MLLGTLSLLAWGHRLGAALLSALLIGFGLLLGALARLSARDAPRDQCGGGPAPPPHWSRRLSG